MNMSAFFRTLHILAQRHLSDHVYRVLVSSPAFQRFAAVSSQQAAAVVKKAADTAVKAADVARKFAGPPKSTGGKK
ncbi:hypothetical protein, conserved [Eimeria necatrix]|uniref:Uncharacterized protein n=1 Tax=Eimeria necatrix TaxID=51315 RepID=U6N940_9EIME|nr:hypothetical protein, conserved [Eimeria necatrix]CDJ70391.1 hypothetical protein, conserved [Eimeria necatrix]